MIENGTSISHRLGQMNKCSTEMWNEISLNVIGTLNDIQWYSTVVYLHIHRFRGITDSWANSYCHVICVKIKLFSKRVKIVFKNKNAETYTESRAKREKRGWEEEIERKIWRNVRGKTNIQKGHRFHDRIFFPHQCVVYVNIKSTKKFYGVPNKQSHTLSPTKYNGVDGFFYVFLRL